jgi:hypothetical protein
MRHSPIELQPQKAALYVASLQKLQGAGVTCSYVVPARFGPMVHCTLKRPAPFASFCGETRGVTKNLEADPAVAHVRS